MYRWNISYKQFYVTLNEKWLYESDPNAPSTCSEPGGKQWQCSIGGQCNWDVKLSLCAVIRHLCSVAFMWETKQSQVDSHHLKIVLVLEIKSVIVGICHFDWVKGIYCFALWNGDEHSWNCFVFVSLQFHSWLRYYYKFLRMLLQHQHCTLCKSLR